MLRELKEENRLDVILALVIKLVPCTYTLGLARHSQLLHVDHAGHSCTGLTVPSLSLSHMLRVHKLWAWANEPTG